MSTQPLSDGPSHPPSPPRPKSVSGPPLADNVVRPFTSQGSSFRSPFRPLTHSQLDRPSTASDSHNDLHSAKLGPYISASARTSYTRVDVDSLPSPEYPLLPTVHSTHNVLDTAMDPTATTTPTPPTDAPASGSSGAQPLTTELPIPQTPQVSLTFLLVTGRRKTQSFEPETTVGRVKELVWNAWPARDAEWQDERPPAPSYFRILYLGKILQDDDTLIRVGFPTSLPSASNTSPTIVHLSIRPYGTPSDDPALSKKRRLGVAITRRFSSGGVHSGEHDPEREARRAGCCTGCTIC